MRSNEDYGALMGIVFAVIIIMVVVYVVCLIAAATAAVAAAGGTIYGSGTAIGNYVSSFKENMIDSNKMAA